MVAGAISVSSISLFSLAARFFVGVELFLFFRAGDGVPSLRNGNERIQNIYNIRIDWPVVITII